jgi:hypothetical protein
MARKCVIAIAVTILIACAAAAHAQVFSNKEVGEKNEALADSLKHSEYPYMLPIWGDKATHRGFNLPYSAGVSVQYLGQRSDILIDNLMVGFNGGPMHDLDGLVRFDKARSTTNGISLRPDVWLFPFLDLYGILARSSASTEVGYGIWLPDSAGNERKIVSLGSKVNFDANTFGFGLTPTIGVGGGWLALDMNFTWTDIPQLEQPATAFVFDPRMGKLFRLRNADENVNVWVGGFRLALNTGTSGSLPLGEALPIDQWQSSVNQGLQQVEKLNQEIDAWWNGLSPPQQANPANKAKYDATKAALARAGAYLEAADQALSTAGSSTVQYSIDKRPKDMWNLIVGGQYQYNKSWMIRAEAGFLTSRLQVLAGIQYRFGL